LDGTVPMFSNRVLIFMLMLAAWSICMLAAALTDRTPWKQDVTPQRQDS